MRVRNGADETELSGTLRRNLLAALLIRANESVSADTLLDTLYGAHRDPGGPSRLQVLVHRLRAVLDDPARLSFGPRGYRLRVLPGELDAELFCTLVDRAVEHAANNPRRCADLIREALQLWEGNPYPGVDIVEIAAETERLLERRMIALEQLYAAELRCARAGAVISDLSNLVDQHPLRERLHALLITALHQDGRRADALAAYRHARRTLVEQLGLEPGRELRALEQRILHDADATPAPTAAAAVPAQLPYAASGFTGRADELSQLDRMLAEPSGSARITAVVGGGGVGKTALVIRWAHRVVDLFPDGQLFLDLRGYGPDRPMPPAEALATMLRSLAVDASAIPSDPRERASLFRTVIAHRRMLIVLDNAHDADQVRPLLPGASTCLVLITSRNSLSGLAAREGAHRLDLSRMTDCEAYQLLQNLLGDRCDADPAATRRLIERCARLPLALRIAAERVRAHPRRAVADLLPDLADEQGILDVLEMHDDPQTSVRAVFAASYRHLEPGAARLFRLIGLHPGQDIDYDAASVLTGDDLRTTRRSLTLLAQAHLIEEGADRGYRPHDLIRAYAVELAESIETSADRLAALTRLVDYYHNTTSRATSRVAAVESTGRVAAPAETGCEDTHYVHP